jgi:hypothetical protein
VEPNDTMRRLSDRLGVINDSQDCGIINGSAERYEEFLRFYEFGELNTIERCAMAELVLASANERLVHDPTAPLDELPALLDRVARDASWVLDYWVGVNPSSHPLAGWLRRHL